MRVKSSIDLLYRILIWITVAILIASIFTSPKKERIIGVIVIFPILVFIMWLYFGTYYEFHQDYLYCRSGPFFEKIPYDKIKSLKLSKNMFSSMALSRKRIEIKQHGKGYIMGTTFISPINREVFLEELIKRCSNLEQE